MQWNRLPEGTRAARVSLARMLIGHAAEVMPILKDRHLLINGLLGDWLPQSERGT